MTKSTLDELLKAPEAQIRSVLRALCSDRTVQRHALEHFDALKSEEGSGGGGQKRKAAGDLLICVQCGQPFTEEENDRKACWYHWGSEKGYVSGKHEAHPNRSKKASGVEPSDSEEDWGDDDEDDEDGY